MNYAGIHVLYLQDYFFDYIPLFKEWVPEVIKSAPYVCVCMYLWVVRLSVVGTPITEHKLVPYASTNKSCRGQAQKFVKLTVDCYNF